MNGNIAGQVADFGHISGQKALPLREILAILKETYTGYIGVQFMHIDALNEREWLQQRMETTRNRISLSRKTADQNSGATHGCSGL